MSLCQLAVDVLYLTHCDGEPASWGQKGLGNMLSKSDFGAWDIK